MRKLIWLLLIGLLTVLWISCGDDPSTSSGQANDDDNDDETPDDDAADDDDDDDDDASETTRSFYMAAAPYQFTVTDTSVSGGFKFDGFENNTDLISLHTDGFFGIPWDEFADQSELPAAWLAEMESLRDAVDDLGVDIYLSLTPLSGMRDSIAAKATDVDGELVVDEEWRTGCYNFNTAADATQIRAAYLNYVDWMVDYFEPIFLTHVIEMNLYDLACPDDYQSVIDLANAAYDQEKSARPDLPVFPTFTVQDMWSYGEFGECEVGDDACLKANLARQESLERDRIGLSSYPVFMQWEWDELQEDFYSAFAELTGEPVVIGEIGWNTHDVVAPFPTLEDECMAIFTTSDQDQIDFMEWLFADMEQVGSDLVVWWSLRDYLPDSVLDGCPCNAPGLWCVVYDAFAEMGLHVAWLHWGSMGVLDYDGNAKPSYATWNAWLSRERKD